MNGKIESVISFVNDIFHMLSKTKNFDMNNYTSKLMHYFNLTLVNKKLKPTAIAPKCKKSTASMFDDDQ